MGRDRCLKLRCSQQSALGEVLLTELPHDRKQGHLERTGDEHRAEAPPDEALPAVSLEDLLCRLAVPDRRLRRLAHLMREAIKLMREAISEQSR
jgi:hypothetical protein